MRVTADLLRSKTACEDQLATFVAEWPDGVEVTEKSLLRAVEMGLDLEWAAHNLLTAPAGEAYEEAVAPARKVYEEACAPARKVYEEAVAPARKVYIKAPAQAEKVYDEAVAPARKVYIKATAQAWKIYDEAVAAAFLAALRVEEGEPVKSAENLQDSTARISELRAVLALIGLSASAAYIETAVEARIRELEASDEVE